jgi:aldehyde dehydrogenase (NAD+)
MSIQAPADHKAYSSQPFGAFDLSDVREVFATGRTRGLSWRLAQLEAIERLCDEREADIAEALHADLGRPSVEAWLGDIAPPRAKPPTRESI